MSFLALLLFQIYRLKVWVASLHLKMFFSVSLRDGQPIAFHVVAERQGFLGSYLGSPLYRNRITMDTVLNNVFTFQGSSYT